ncbi:uncharacterized protein LOC122001436 isoform X1 [Zingiber officinale]|uniref:uncharacterized protein LOC122001436 isoform X1 n=1 Tax=Zingiber officinale TaxID=94328 RepID=UPI001C4B29E2|nr:uncharacterized protein LOC122001436 isoform X1 [Zingiber officinale]
MANPRKITLALRSNSDLPPPPPPLSSPSSSSAAAALSSIVFFFKRPSALPLLLSLFVLLTWLFLQLEHPTSAGLRSSFPSGSSNGSQSSARSLNALDSDANVVRFDAVDFPSKIARDWRGWLMDPVKAAREAGLPGIFTGRALKCASVHVGQIQPGGIRGNHRHNMCNETFILWGAETKFRLENPKDKGYTEVTFGPDEVVLAVSPQGTAHAIINIDPSRATFILGCQDNIIKNSSGTDYNVWKDL